MQTDKLKVKSQKSKVSNIRGDIGDGVMKKIESREIRMKPKWYFVAGSVLVTTGLGVLGLGLVFLFNVVIFLLKKHGPGGQWRLELMVSEFPWWVLLMAGLGLVSGLCLLKRYDFSYKKNFGLILAGLLAAILICAWLVDASGVNETWSQKGPMRRFYQQRKYFGR